MENICSGQYVYICVLCIFLALVYSIIYEQSNNVSTLVRTSNNSNSTLLASAVLLSLSVDASSFVEELFSKDGKALVLEMTLLLQEVSLTEI